MGLPGVRPTEVSCFQKSDDTASPVTCPRSQTSAPPPTEKAEEMARQVLIRETKAEGGREDGRRWVGGAGGVCAVCGNWKARISGR